MRFLKRLICRLKDHNMQKMVELGPSVCARCGYIDPMDLLIAMSQTFFQKAYKAGIDPSIEKEVEQ